MGKVELGERDSMVGSGAGALTRRALLASAFAGAAAVRSRPSAAAGVSRYFRTSDGVQLHYLDAGSGPTVVFVPGWCMPGWIFDRQLRYLSQRYRVVALDPRGQGASDVPSGGYEPQRRGSDIGDLLAQLPDERLVLAGWSLGVLDSLSYLAAAGDRRIAGLVLVDNSIGEGKPGKGRSPTFFDNLRKDQAGTMDGFVRSMFTTAQSEAFIQAIVRDALRMPAEAAISLLTYPKPREFWRDTLYSTQRPVYYAVRPIFANQANLLVQKRPQAEFEIYDDAGHALFVDRADRFNQAMSAFLQARAQWS